MCCVIAILMAAMTGLVFAVVDAAVGLQND